jgi:type II secretory ATPase GspE/PulE/Tfp pilus assembly ATPase PilB-like protein
VSGGMRRMREDGLNKVRQGITSVPEVLRVVGK